MAVSHGLDFLANWIVTPKLMLEANPFMGSVSWVRIALPSSAERVLYREVTRSIRICDCLQNIR